MNIENAVEILGFIVETQDEKDALKFLVDKAKKEELGDVASSKQIYFITTMAKAADIDVFDVFEELEIEPVEDLRLLPKKSASAIIKEYIKRGYKEKLDASK